MSAGCGREDQAPAPSDRPPQAADREEARAWVAGSRRRLRVAAMADLHYRKDSGGTFEALFGRVAESADVLLLCGDIVDYGLPEEAHLLARELDGSLAIPVIAVLGNHEYESDKGDAVQAILAAAGIHVLDGEAVEVHGVGFAGVKGFGGGFGERALQPWGEATVKAFVREAVNEAVKLESALAKLRTPNRIALLHYAPIQATVEGEAREILPFLGSSRLEEPLNRYGVTAAFHGHAHRGVVEGRTAQGVAVYNVAMPLLRATAPEHAPFFLLDVPLAGPAPDLAHGPAAPGGAEHGERVR